MRHRNPVLKHAKTAVAYGLDLPIASLVRFVQTFADRHCSALLKCLIGITPTQTASRIQQPNPVETCFVSHVSGS